MRNLTYLVTANEKPGSIKCKTLKEVERAKSDIRAQGLTPKVKEVLIDVSPRPLNLTLKQFARRISLQ